METSTFTVMIQGQPEILIEVRLPMQGIRTMESLQLQRDLRRLDADLGQIETTELRTRTDINKISHTQQDLRNRMQDRTARNNQELHMLHQATTEFLKLREAQEDTQTTVQV